MQDSPEPEYVAPTRDSSTASVSLSGWIRMDIHHIHSIFSPTNQPKVKFLLLNRKPILLDGMLHCSVFVYHCLRDITTCLNYIFYLITIVQLSWFWCRGSAEWWGKWAEVARVVRSGFIFGWGGNGTCKHTGESSLCTSSHLWFRSQLLLTFTGLLISVVLHLWWRRESLRIQVSFIYH